MKCYQFCIRPFLGHCCRFTPTCSSYAIESLETHSVFKSCLLIIYRILRCHPWTTGGHDPVPQRSKNA